MSERLLSSPNSTLLPALPVSGHGHRAGEDGKADGKCKVWNILYVRGVVESRVINVHLKDQDTIAGSARRPTSSSPARAWARAGEKTHRGEERCLRCASRLCRRSPGHPHVRPAHAAPSGFGAEPQCQGVRRRLAGEGGPVAKQLPASPFGTDDFPVHTQDMP